MVNYEKVVKAALKGDESAFAQLYESTQHDMYYIALKYMKNEDDAMDVVQDSYIKAWRYLGTIRDPENFPSWLGRIVANTARNMLARKKPLLFSEMSQENEDGDLFEYEIEDEKAQYQPERNYTQKETQELVHELIDSLSDEQRLCILMYHLDDQSIKDIAVTFGISENTVKSRLLYGRKAIKTKAEALQKKGYQLYTAAPVGLLLYLLLSDRKSDVYAATAQAVLQAQRATILNKANTQAVVGKHKSVNKNTAGRSAGRSAGKNVGKAAGKAAGRTFLHTTAGKVIAAVAAIAVAGGGAAGIVQYQNSVKKPETVQQEEAKAKENPKPTEAPEESASTATPEPTEVPATPTPSPEPTPTTPPIQQLADDEYSSRIAGNLNKQELEFVLAYGVDEVTDNAAALHDTFYTLNELCLGVNSSRERMIQKQGTTGDWESMYLQSDVNRYFSSFTDFQFTEGYASGSIQVQNGYVIFGPAELSWSTTVSITDTSYTDSLMKIHYIYTKTSAEDGSVTSNRVATLVPVGNGLYRIIKIEGDTGAPDVFDNDTAAASAENQAEPAPGENQAEPAPDGTQTDFEENQAEPAPEQTDTTQETQAEGSVTSAYQSVLQSVAANQDGYTFPEVSQEYLTGTKVYTLYDIDQNGTPELIVGAEFRDSGKYLLYDYHVYTCDGSDGNYQAHRVAGDGFTVGCEAAPDGNGILRQEIASIRTMETNYYRGTLQNGTLTFDTTPLYTSDYSTDYSTFPVQKILNWMDISDMSGLN